MRGLEERQIRDMLRAPLRYEAQPKLSQRNIFRPTMVNVDINDCQVLLIVPPWQSNQIIDHQSCSGDKLRWVGKILHSSFTSKGWTSASLGRRHRAPFCMHVVKFSLSDPRGLHKYRPWRHRIAHRSTESSTGDVGRVCSLATTACARIDRWVT
jgi:hypothetical protein